MASTSAFKPHGLIRTPIEEVLYYKAHIANVYTGIADPKEHETVALMLAILYSNVFPTRENFAVSAEQPPTPDSDTRCDIVVRYLESGYQKIRALCFAECKRAKKSQAFSLKALEEQALGYCGLYLEHEKVPFVYAATMAGAHVRLWGCYRDKAKLQPFWGPQSEGDWKQYKDLGNDEGARPIEAGFTRMKQFPPTPHAGQTNETYGTLYQLGISSHTTTLNYQAAPSGSQVAPSGFQATPLGFQVTSPGYQAGHTSLAISGTPMRQYTYPVPGAHEKPSGQMSGENEEGEDAQMEEENEEGKDDDYNNDEDDDDGDEKIGEDNKMGGDAKTQYTTLSGAKSKHIIVRVTKKTHTLGADDFIFTDSKGKKRTTKRKDWKKILFNQQPAFMYSRYICLDNHFD